MEVWQWKSTITYAGSVDSSFPPLLARKNHRTVRNAMVMTLKSLKSRVRELQSHPMVDIQKIHDFPENRSL